MVAQLLSHSRLELGGFKYLPFLKINIITRCERKNSLTKAERCVKYKLYRKMRRTKLLHNSQRTRTSLSLAVVVQGDSKDLPFLNSGNCKTGSLWG